jgi:rare lipoprotein A
MKRLPERSRLRLVAIALLCACLIGAGCAKKKRRAQSPAAPAVKTIEYGIASWYGHPYHGRRAANGEVYDMEALVAAHRTLPFGTWVEVRNLDNQRSVTVRIIDRGPFIEGRIIDLSKAAAREVRMIGPGTANVQIRIVRPPPDAPPFSTYAIQIGAFQDRRNAESIRRRFEDEYGLARLVPRPGNPPSWRVLVGREATLDAAQSLRDRIAQAGQAAFVVRLDDSGGVESR